jgi:hypothetical protein
LSAIAAVNPEESIMKHAAYALALALGTLTALPALASDTCPAHPKDQWLKPEQIKAKAEELGYTVRSVGEEDGCLEVKGMDKNGKRVEVYFDPVTAAVVKTKGEG